MTIKGKINDVMAVEKVRTMVTKNNDAQTTSDEELRAQNEHIRAMKKDNPHGCGADARARYFRSLGITE